MVTGGSYTCGEHSMTYRDVESRCCTPETNVTLCVDYAKKKKKKVVGGKANREGEGREKPGGQESDAQHLEQLGIY